MKALCFVVMPFGTKRADDGTTIDFDAVYQQLYVPAITQAELEPIRADGETIGGIIHRPMFERLRLCDYAVADVTTANANVFYELGVRHAVRPHTTVLTFAAGYPLPFDVAPLRAMPYSLSGGSPTAAEAFVGELAKRLRLAQQLVTDSPIYQLLEDWPSLSLDKSDAFRERVAFEVATKRSLAKARVVADEAPRLAAIRAVDESLGDLQGIDYGVLVELLLSYRAASAWDSMIDLFERLPKELQSQTFMRQQHGMALNRVGRSAEAEEELSALIADQGASPETCGLLGRVFKDRYRESLKQNRPSAARGFLDRAIDMYLKGFQADWRDAYPGVNAVELMAERDPTDPLIAELVPVVAYASRRSTSGGAGTYWDQATLMELAVLANDEGGARESLASALGCSPESWMTETTAKTLQGIIERGAQPWVNDLHDELVGHAD